MKAFKYLVFILLTFISLHVAAATKYYIYNDGPYSSQQAACSSYIASYYPDYDPLVQDGSCYAKYKNNNGVLTSFPIVTRDVQCPSATSKDLKVPVNSKSYVCVQGCQYRLRACVDVQFDSGGNPDGGDSSTMSCSAISTGQDCGTTPPPPTNDPNNPSPETATPDPVTGPPSENTANSESTSTSTSNSTSTSTTTNNTTTTNTTTTTNNTTTTNTTINLDRLEQIMNNLTSVISNKLDAILGKMDQDGGSEGGTGDGTDLTDTNAKLDENNSLLSDLKDWLTGGDDGSNGTGGDNPFGNDEVPEKALTPQDLKTNIFGGSASCPADRTLSFQLFTGKSFSKDFSFAMWCDKLAIFGTLILIASYLYGAYIIVSKS